MKAGRTINELAVELRRRDDAKKDFLVPATSHRLAVLEDGGGVAWDVDGAGRFAPTEHFHGQVALHTQIPQPFFNRLREGFPELLAENVNTLLRGTGKPRLVRTMDGTARAFLSDRYRRIDNWMIASPALEALSAIEPQYGLTIASCEVTERKLYIKALFPRIESKVRGDVVQAGVVIENSEIGLGHMSVSGLIYTLECKNGMIREAALKRRHTGRRLGNGNDETPHQLEHDPHEIYADDTLRADDAALLLKVRDMVRASVDEASFTRAVARLEDAGSDRIEQAPDKAVEVLAKTFQLDESERSNVLIHLCKGGDLSRYGLLSAVTRSAQDVESYDRATELEKLGGRILELPREEWKAIAQLN